MLSPEKQEILIVRRGEDEDGAVKGGAWKIAHADFMTAMMAFFLIMWLVGISDQETKAGIANFFNPIQLADSTSNKKGLEDPENVPPDHKTDDDMKGKEKGSGLGTGGKSEQLQKPRFKEGALFQDPYAVLAKIAEEVEPNPHDTLGADVTPGESDVPGLSSGEAFRDPFDPLYWQVAPVEEMKAEGLPKPGTASPAPTKAEIDVLAPSKPNAAATDRPASGTSTAATLTESKHLPEKPAPATKSATATSAEDAVDLKAAELKREIMNAVQPGMDAAPQPRIEVRRTGSGTMISLTDDFDFSMFAVGSAEPHAKVVQAMAKIAGILQSRSGKIVIRGHTDSRPFKSANYDNWRLSHARAQMALYMLVRGGLNENRIVRVEGHADRDPKVPSDPKADQNRRVEILLEEH